MPYRKVGKGDRVSEYTLIDKLGEGGFGEVWKAEHAQLRGKFVAIKIPTTPESTDCLKREAVFQHRLDHPNIVRTIGLDTQNDPPYFVMEYVEGQNLRQLMLSDGILPPPYAIDIAVQVCEALAFAHSKNVVHKDVKPENILVEKRKVDVSNKGKALLHCVKLTDLGLGQLPGRTSSEIVISENARTSGVRILSGTLFYMSPEQMVPGREVDARADIYSLGVVLYEMLTGELPLGMDLPSELNPVVSPELDAICKRALSIDRDIRYQGAREMAVDLQRAKDLFLQRLVAQGAPALELRPGGELRRFTPKAVPLHGAVARSPGRGRRWLPALEWALLAFVVCLLGVAGYAFHRINKKAAELAADGPKGAPAVFSALGGPLRISSRPEGAEVWFDGRRAGVTPVEIREVTFERHAVVLVREFHADRELALEPGYVRGQPVFRVLDRRSGEEVALLECASGCAIVGIEQPRERGRITITTPRVEKASVYIDGEYHGPTPFTHEALEAGVHHFSISKEGFKEFSFYEKIQAGDSLAKEVSLLEAGRSEIEPSGLIRAAITSVPPGATLYVNSEERGATPAVIEIPAGTIELRIVKTYYEPRVVNLAVNSRTEVGYTLEKVKSRVSFDSDPPGAVVSLDGKKIGASPVTDFAIEGGSYRATFSMEGYFDQTAAFEVVGRDAVGPVKATLQKVPPALLAFDCEVRDAEIFLDGKALGRAPLAPKAVVSGRHKVRVLGAERAVSLEPGLEKKLTLSLRDLDMVRVPGGDFTFGSASPRPGEFRVTTEKTGAFYIDRFEVTNAQYALFLASLQETGDHSRCHPDEARRAPRPDHKPVFWGDKKYESFLRPNHPVVGVTWFDAYACAAWSGKRLPTEREWEKAARANTAWIFPWGNDWDPAETRCNYSGNADGFELTAPVGACNGPSPYGCFDMVGNVHEWCADDYSPKNANKVVRGGSYLGKEWNTTTSREYEGPLVTSTALGFRCVVDEKK